MEGGMRFLMMLFLMAFAFPAIAQTRPIAVPLQMICTPAESWAREPDMKGILGGMDDASDVWSVYASETGFNILVTFQGLICLVGSGNEVGDHLILPIPVAKKGKAS